MSAEDEAVAVVGAAISHVVAFRAADFVAGEVCGGEKFYFCNDDCFVAGCDGVGGGIGELVGGHEERVCGGVEDPCFVEIGGPGVFDEALEGGVGAEDGEEGVMVYEEGFGLGSCGGDQGGSGESQLEGLG